jgi:hypothetical protein
MDKTELREIFESAYDPDQWQLVMREVFQVRVIHQQPVRILLPKNDLAYDAYELGNTRTANGRTIGFYLVNLKTNVWLKINKIGLRMLLRNVYKYEVDGALIVFVQDKKWRFSYVSEIRVEEGKQETEPKRYTYLFGEGEVCRTASDRFSLIHGKSCTLDDISDAFSVDKLNKEFFNKYKSFYHEFCNFLADPENGYRKLFIDKRESSKIRQEKPIRDFVKILLGRFVFLHFLQKKAWLGVPSSSGKWENGNTHFMQNLFKICPIPNKFHSRYLRKLFFETINTRRKDDLAPMELGENIRIPYLNGGLFDTDISFFHDIDFPSGLFFRLLDFFEQFNFTIDENSPDDQEVGIDPEMLGHIFENLLEENREKGAFYTPKEIVHYMCQESLLQYLITNLPDCDKKDGANCKALDDFVRKSFIEDPKNPNNFIVKNARMINDLLDNLKICDPAIGSGAFPMGMLREILNMKSIVNMTIDRAQVKKNIIQNTIYGVDIDKGAVDIARLRFWLALIVDDDEPRPLPNLDYKIMQGNSLLEQYEGIDLSKSVMFDEPSVTFVNPQTNIFTGTVEDPLLRYNFSSEDKSSIKKLIDEYFQEEDKERKTEIHKKIDRIVLNHIDKSLELFEKNLLIDIEGLKQTLIRKQELNQKKDKTLREIEKRQVQLAQKGEARKKLIDFENTSDRPYFLWHLYFGDVFKKGGFDIIIGNPPFIQLQSMGKDCDALEQDGFSTFTRTGDVYCLFYEQGRNLLKQNGVLIFITSNKWMNAAYGKNLRQFFLENTNPLLLIDFSKTVIFPAAVVFVNILLFKKQANNFKIIGVKAQSDFQIGQSNISEYVKNKFVSLDNFSSDNWFVAERLDFEITKQIDEVGTPLKEWNLNFYRGITSGLNEAFYINEEIKNEITSKNPVCAEIIVPLLRGKHIKRWTYSFQQVYLINSHNGVRELNIPRIDVKADYPEIYQHLLQYYDKKSPRAIIKSDGTIQTLKDRADQGDHWTNLRNCAFIEEFKKEKIIWIEISDRANYCLDTEGHYLTNSAYFMTGNNLKYLLALLNSRLMDFYFFQKTAQIAGGRKRYTKQYVELLPIRQIDDRALICKFEILVDYMIYLNNSSKPQVNPFTENINIASVFEDVLNMMVYELYFEEHMKAEEINVLEYIDYKNHFLDISQLTNDEKIKQIIGNAYNKLQEQNDTVRNRIILSNIKSRDIIRRINSTTH